MLGCSQKISVTIQARMNSSRLPGKVLAPICGKPALELMVERLKTVKYLNNIIIATTDNKIDDPIARLADKLEVYCFRGSEENVLSRVLGAARAYPTDIIVQTTGDCPLIDPRIINKVIETYFNEKVDYCANIIERTYPIGMDVQVFSKSILESVERLTSNPEDLEHVSCYIYKNPQIYKLKNVSAEKTLFCPKLRLTLDTPEDLELITKIYEALYSNQKIFFLDNILGFLQKNKNLKSINKHIKHKWLDFSKNK